MEATITPTGVPGLFNVQTADGRSFTDLTVGQVDALIANEGLVPAGAA